MSQNSKMSSIVVLDYIPLLVYVTAIVLIQNCTQIFFNLFTYYVSKDHQGVYPTNSNRTLGGLKRRWRDELDTHLFKEWWKRKKVFSLQ